MKTIKKELDETDKNILERSSQGQTSKQIGYHLNISCHMVSARIREMKKYYDCKSLVELVARFVKQDF
jgi:DNA-binding CsgD family transcriptional regulator